MRIVGTFNLRIVAISASSLLIKINSTTRTCCFESFNCEAIDCQVWKLKKAPWFNTGCWAGDQTRRWTNASQAICDRWSLFQRWQPKPTTKRLDSITRFGSDDSRKLGSAEQKPVSQKIAVRANHEDKCTGRFWEGRYKSQALLDEASILACAMYVDLNPIRAANNLYSAA